MMNTLQMGWQSWNLWCERSVNRRVLAAIVTVGGLTILVKLAAVAQGLVTAYHFGTSDAFDAFVIAFLLPAFVIELIGGALNAALIPTYVQVQEHEGQEAAQRLLSSVMSWSLAVLISASILLALLADFILPFLGSGFNPEKLALTRQLYFILLPALVFYGLSTTWSAILNAGERFALGAVVRAVTPLVVILLLVTLAERWGIYVVAIGMVAGFALEAGLLAWGLNRQGIFTMPRWYGANRAVRQVFRQYVPVVAAAFLIGSTSIIGQAMAAMLGPGSVSVLAYGGRATSLLLGIGSVAISTAVLPHFSRMVALGDLAGVRHTLKTYTRLILMITLPLAAILIICSEPLVRLFFQRGAFTGADTQIVAQVQAVYLLQVPAFVLEILFVRLISSLQANKFLLWGTMISLALNIILNYIFLQWLGVIGIALSISLMHVVSAGYLICVALWLTKDTLNAERVTEPVLSGQVRR